MSVIGEGEAARNDERPSVVPQGRGRGGAAHAASLVVGAAAAVVLMVLALWAWTHAAEVATSAWATGASGRVSRPYVFTWAVRSAAVAAAAAAQAVLLVAVVGRVYRRRGAADAVLRLFALLVFVVALVSAAALALAGR